MQVSVHRPVSASCLYGTIMFEFAGAFWVREQHWRFDANTRLWLRTCEDQSLPPSRSYQRRLKSIKASTIQRFKSPLEETQCLPPLPRLYLEPSSTLSILTARRRRPLGPARPDRSTCGCPTAATASPARPTPAAPSMECPSCCRLDWPERQWTLRPVTSRCLLSRTWCAP